MTRPGPKRRETLRSLLESGPGGEAQPGAEASPQADNLRSEIGLLRGMMGQLLAQTADLQSLDEWALVLDRVGRAATRIATLLEKEQNLQRKGTRSAADDLSTSLSQALAEVIAEMKGQ